MLRSLLRSLIVMPLRFGIRLLFMPYYAWLDLRNRATVRRHGDVLSLRTLRQTRGGTFCVFLLYPQGRLPSSVRRAMAALARKDISIVAVTNRPLDEADAAYLGEIAHTVIVRRNIGRDFGGYRTGILYLLDKCAPDRIIILNDSVYYIEKGLDGMIAALAGPDEFVGATENHQLSYHLGSFALGFGPKVIGDVRFRQFWESYRLTEARPRVIRQGEMGLSRLVTERIGVRPRVIYSPGKLAAKLETLPTDELLQLATLMPTGFSLGFQFRRNTKRSGWSGIHLPPEASLPETTLDDAARVATLPPDKMVELMQRGYRNDLRRQFIDAMYRSSQIHYGAPLLVQLLDCPIIKNDLLLRMLYSAGSLGRFASMMAADEFAEFYAMSLGRGEPSYHWTFRKRLLLEASYL